MPVNMTVKEPHARIISHESNHEVTTRGQDEGVSSRRIRWKGSIWRVIRDKISAVGIVIEIFAVWRVSIHHLEVIAVEMEWMGASVLIAENDLHDVKLVLHPLIYLRRITLTASMAVNQHDDLAGIAILSGASTFLCVIHCPIITVSSPRGWPARYWKY